MARGRQAGVNTTAICTTRFTGTELGEMYKDDPRSFVYCGCKPSWQELVAKEPKLLALWKMVRRLPNKTEDDYDRADILLHKRGGIIEQLEQLVGFEVSHIDSLLGTVEAFDVAWKMIYAALPPRTYRPLKPSVRFKVLARDHFTCQYCGQKAPDVELEVDHIVPKAECGSNELSNLTTACKDCNRGKAGSSLTSSII